MSKQGIKRRQKHVCVLATQRTGSSWLMQMLNNHPEIYSFGESFAKTSTVAGQKKKGGADARLWPPIRFDEYIEAHPKVFRPFSVARYLKALHQKTESSAVIAYKIMYNQLIYFAELFGLLLIHRYVIIHLVRENYLEIALSGLFMQKTGQAHRFDEVQEVRQKTYLKPQAVLRMIRNLDRYSRLMRLILFLWPLKIIRVRYEDLEKTLRRSWIPSQTLSAWKGIYITRRDSLKKH